MSPFGSPYTYDQNLNDATVIDGTTDFFGGMNNSNKATLLPMNAAQSLVNVDIVDTGKARTRLFTAHYGNVASGQVVHGICYFKKPETPADAANGIAATDAVDALVVACNGSLYQRTSAGAWEVVAGYTYDVTNVKRVALIQANNKLIISDGAQNQYAWDGTTMSKLGGKTNAKTVDDKAESTGDIPAGQCIDGTLADGTTRKKCNANIVPPAAPYLAWHNCRMFAAGDSGAPDTLYVSQILDTGWYRMHDALDIGEGEGDAITGIAPWKGSDFIVCKQFSTWLVAADPRKLPMRWAISKLTPNVGCVAHATLAALGDDLLFLSNDGVAQVSFYMGDETRGVSTLLSDPIRPLIQRINWKYAHLSSATVWRNKYLLSVPLDNAMTPNAVIVYDATFKCWCGYWTGINARGFCKSVDEGELQLCFGDDQGNVRYFDEVATATTYDRVPDGNGGTQKQDVVTEVVTKGYNFGELLATKTGKTVSLQFHSSEADASLSVILNESLVDGTLWTGTTSASEASVVMPSGAVLSTKATQTVSANIQTLGTFNDIAFKITSTAGLLSLRSVILLANINAIT